jgi:soluble lytic murein transglycosylase
MMKNKTGRTRSYALVIVIILAVSVLFGFVFDFALTQIEYAIYKKPAEYQGFIAAYATEYGVPEHLIYAVIKTESGFDSSAVSKAGAIGLMQLMPDTFTWLTNDKLRDRLAQGMLYDPETSIKYGAYYLSFLYSQYNNWDTVLAAYNAGPGNVDSWLADERYDNDQDGVLDKIPFKETNNYVKKVNRALQAYDELYE